MIDKKKVGERHASSTKPVFLVHLIPTLYLIYIVWGSY